MGCHGSPTCEINFEAAEVRHVTSRRVASRRAKPSRPDRWHPSPFCFSCRRLIPFVDTPGCRVVTITGLPDRNAKQRTQPHVHLYQHVTVGYCHSGARGRYPHLLSLRFCLSGLVNVRFLDQIVPRLPDSLASMQPPQPVHPGGRSSETSPVLIAIWPMTLTGLRARVPKLTLVRFQYWSCRVSLLDFTRRRPSLYCSLRPNLPRSQSRSSPPALAIPLFPSRPLNLALPLPPSQSRS
jgi:hypothetical protein